MTQAAGGRRNGKMVSSPCSHQASVLENVIILWSIKGGARERIMAEDVLAANLLGRECEGSRSSVSILIKITVYAQR